MKLELKDVSLRFGHVEALHSVSFSAGSNEVTCLLGDNGAGKSSLIEAISGITLPREAGTCTRYVVGLEALSFMHYASITTAH